MDNYQNLKQLSNISNILLKDILEIDFFCKKILGTKDITIDSNIYDKKDILGLVVIKNGNIKKNETLTDIRSNYLSYLMNEFNMTDYLNKKYDESKKI